jgi:3-dehydroquinate dehydratase II
LQSKDFLYQYYYFNFETSTFTIQISTMKIIIINGPNLNLLGKREPEIYGNQDFESYLKKLQEKFSDFEISYFQSNIEGEIINKLQEVGFSYDGIILNAGAYTHTSIAIGDCIKAIKTPVIEVHISNTFSRETFRHQSYISPNAAGVIIGFGLQSYDLALQSFVK